MSRQALGTRAGLGRRTRAGRAALAVPCVLAAVAFLAGTARAAAGPDAATIRGKAIAASGATVPGVRVTLSAVTPPGQPAQTWTATTSRAGTCTLSVPVTPPLVQQLSVAVEAPPGAKLAPCAVMPAEGLRVEAGQSYELTILLAPATAGLKGTVTDAAGRPVRGATVTAHFGQLVRVVTRTGTTDADGRYEIAGLVPGGYVVQSVEPAAGSNLIRLSTWRPHGVRSVALEDGQTRTEDFQVPRGARLAGRVLDEGGRPLPGAAVSCRLDVATEDGPRAIYQQPGQWYQGEATTDAQGRYALGGLTQETYVVEVQPADGADLAPGSLRGVNAPKEGDVPLQDIVLYRGAVLRGKVVGPDGQPVAEAEASLALPLGRWGTMVNAKTDAEGVFEFRRLPSGRYTVTVRPPVGSAATETSFEGVAAVRGLATETRLPLPEGARVAGTVTAPDSRPVPGATVTARYGYHSRGKAVTDERGRYTLLGLSPPAQPGPRRQTGPQNEVVVAPPRELPCLRTSSAPLPDLPLGGSATVDVRMEPGVAVAGRVTGPGGRPIEGCQVGVSERRPAVLLGHGSTRTDAAGRFLLPHLPQARMYLAIQPPEGVLLLGETTPEQSFEAGKPTTVDVALGPGAALVGHAVTTKGTPLVGARIVLQQSTGPYPRFTRSLVSGVGGAFRIEPVPAGSYEFQCMPSHPGLCAKTTSATIEGRGEHQVRLVAYRAASVRGVVRTAGGQALGQGMLWLTLQPAAGGGQPSQGTAHPDTEGRFRMGGFPPGEYSLVVSIGPRGREKDLMAPSPLRVVLNEGEEKELDVRVPTKGGF